MTADAVGGVWTYALDLARGLAETGVTTTLAVMGPPPDDPARAAAESISGLTLLVTGLPLDWTAARACEVEAAGRAVAALAGEFRPDLVHLNSPALVARTRFPAPVLAVAHSCVATWWAAVRSGPLPPDLAWRADLHGAGLRAADAVLAPSRAFAEATMAAYGLPAPPLVVHNGRSARRPAAPAADAPPLFAITAGRLWDEAKNLSTLDRAAARSSVPVLAAGPLRGPNGALATVSHVRALGALGGEALATWMRAAAVFVSPARYEPFGLAVLEAAQAGCALVLSGIPTFRELWDGAALFVEPDDEAALAAALDRLMSDDAERGRLAEAARERAGRYTAVSMVAGTLDAYRALLSRPAAEAAA